MTKKSDAPAIRFKGFSDAWEQRKLTEFVEFFSGLTYTPNDVQENGTLVLRSSNVSNGEVVDADNIYVNPQVVNSENVKVGDIVVVVRNGSRSLIGKHAQIKAFMPNTVIGAFMTGIRSECPEFTNALLNTSRFEEEIAMNMGATINQITGYMFSKMEFKVPCLDEQKKIGEYFEKLDNLITLHQRQHFLHSTPDISLSVRLIHPFYTSSWEQRKVGDLLIERNQQAPMSDEYPLMAFIANEGVAPKGERYDRSALVTDTVNKLYKKTEKGDFIYSSNNLETGSIGLNKYGKACISPVYSIFEPTGIADSDFLGRRLVRKDFINAMVKWRQGVIYGQWRIHESDFLKIEIPVPSVEEQRKIGAYLDQLDNLITLHQRKCVFLFGFFQAFISMIFTASTFSWEQRKLGELVDRVVRKNINNESTLPLTISAQYGLVDQITYFNNRVASRDVSNYYLVLNGEFAYNKSTSDGYPFGAVKRLDLYEKGVLSTLYIVFAPKKEQQIDSDYLTVFFDTDRWHKGVAERAAEGARNHGLLNISAEDFFDIDLSVPKDIVEQKQIGAFIRQLDNLITLHQRKFEKLTNVKKSMLEKMFPQNGSSYPEIRFKGFTDPWEQRKLGEIGSVSMCRRIFKEQTSETGDIPFYKIGTFGADPDAFISRELFEEYKSKYPYPQKGDILISASGSIGRTVEFAGNNEYFQDSNIVWLNHDERLSNPFLKCFYSVVKWAGIEGSTIKRLYNDNILNTVICMPSVPEQKRIGLFFENLDNLITLHQRKPFLMKWRTSDANRNQTNRLVL